MEMVRLQRREPKARITPIDVNLPFFVFRVIDLRNFDTSSITKVEEEDDSKRLNVS